ncbi:MAG: ATP-dependent RNA helicase DbpA [Sulfuricurvum sp.]|uniref:ATP-dependent RNA helicase DbpA n=1 Tax=Sulfuricurvum sp. TaxID=2025608 RepID=UPI002723C649|nr:ATP-dependent RNA helicase DbpA [Sulfuricurvum sp.]MDO9055565.1 ATP-dependent RNA helicase DbpA [Sulfuricurvum sp.]MDP2850505.1 ATP-dependent RNA helicase DbpA [Sulfuricurvum sp.]MDP3292279.1 ATP-dependent RNA helicase DbpA [Sulfuricurvum sp.]
MSSFDTLPLRSPLKEALKHLEFTTMTSIQSTALPIILDKKDCIAQAATGSGKTLAFGLGILNPINPKSFGIQSLILCPTRELAEQVAKVLRSLASEIGNIKILTLCGGVPMRGQLHSLKHGAHIIVGTPGRVLKLLQMEAFDTAQIQTVVLDEADQMIDMGFIEDITTILGFTPPSRQTLLFSATFPESIKTITSEFMKDPVMVRAEHAISKPKIEEIAYICNKKLASITQVLQLHNITNTIVFCNTKVDAAALCDDLNGIGIHALTLHGDMEQFDRNEAIIQFRNLSAPILVATDVAGRGIDIEGLDAIINYEVPIQNERYTHRIGRTGRAGKSGVAITLVNHHQYERFIDLKRPITPIELPDIKEKFSLKTLMRTICIDAGKKEKLRAGDIVGALIHECGLSKEEIGKIDQLDHLSYVAIPRNKAESIYQKLINRPIKGKTFRKWLLD